MEKKKFDPSVQRKFSNLLINPKFQLKHIAFLAMIGAILIFQSCYIFYYFVKANYSLMANVVPSIATVQNELFEDLKSLAVGLGITMAIGLLFFLFLGLYISHQAAGPLYRFKKIFQQIEAGDKAARIHLRRRDDFRDVAESFNKMMDSLTK